jgi:hypothetical protein
VTKSSYKGSLSFKNLAKFKYLGTPVTNVELGRKLIPEVKTTLFIVQSTGIAGISTLVLVLSLVFWFSWSSHNKHKHKQGINTVLFGIT